MHYNTWIKNEPRGEEKVEKLYTTGQMIEMLEQNNRLRATVTCRYGTINIGVNSNGFFEITSPNGADGFEGNIEIGAKWHIIEPEPQKVSFAEAFKRCNMGGRIKSCVSGCQYHTWLINDSEIDGEWIILD
jgi:hypothetical protein